MDNYYTFSEATKEFQNLISNTISLNFPFFSEENEKKELLSKYRESLDDDFDTILMKLSPKFNSTFLNRSSLWKISLEESKRKFNMSSDSEDLNSFFLQEVMHMYAEKQLIEIKKYYQKKNTKNEKLTRSDSEISDTMFNDDIVNSSSKFNTQIKNPAAISGGLSIGNRGNVNKSFEEEKFHAIQGHGFAAERANNLYDKLTGHNAKILGDNNAKNGADRIVDGVYIQSKYCATGSRCINECFENNGHGNFRYMHNERPMQIEVPSDKYDAAVQAMKEKIRRGQVEGITDPSEAENIVRKGHFTYEQAKNIAKAGTIESLSYDAINGIITSTSAFGVTALITFATSTWNGEDFNSALKTATRSGLAVGGATFLTTVIAGQLSRAGLNSALVSSSEAIVKFMGPKASATLVNAFRDGSNIYGAAAMKSAAKLLRADIISVGISTLVFSSVDISRMFRGKISGKQLFKNITTTASTAIGGTAGAIIGSAVIPGVGTLIGSMGGGALANKASSTLLNSFIEDDAEEMLRIIETRLKDLATVYLLNQQEISNVIENLNKLLYSKPRTLMDMFSSINKYSFASDLLIPLIENETSQREYIYAPKINDFSNSLKEILAEIS